MLRNVVVLLVEVVVCLVKNVCFSVWMVTFLSPRRCRYIFWRDNSRE